jgi:hypothetical protein
MSQPKGESGPCKSRFEQRRDTLFQRLRGQRQEIESLLKKAEAQAVTPKVVARGKKQIQVVISREEGEAEWPGLPIAVRATSKDLFQVLSSMYLVNAFSASVAANTAFSKRRIEECYDHLFCAERALGCAIALSGVKQATGSVSIAKAKISHQARTYEKKKRVLDFWRNNINPNLSASKAATLIDEKYLSHSGAIAHATLCEWISAEKKKHTRSS